MRKRFAIFLAIIMAIVGGSLANVTAQPTATSSVIVKLTDGLSLPQQAAVIARNGGTKKSAIPVLRLHVIEVPTAALSGILHKYQSDPQVASAEVNKTRRVAGI